MFSFFKEPFPFFLNDNRKNTILILLTSIFVSFFLVIYAPFETSTHTIQSNISWGILSFIFLYFNIILLPGFFPALFELTDWTVLKYVVFSLWLFVFMGIFFSVINSLFYCGDMRFADVLIKTQKEVTLTGIIPLFIITLLAKNELLKQNLADAVNTNKTLHEIQNIGEKINQQDNIITLSTDTSETFTLKLADLVYVAAVDNYSEVYWRDDNKVSAKLLRVTLKNVETQLGNQFMVRCHRSYLINIREIDSISGNTNGYKLRLKNTEAEIPVSRTKGKEIIAHINQIRDLIDIIR